MKLKNLLEIRKVLSKHASEPIPTLLAYKIMKYMKASDSEGAFYDEKLKAIIEKYALRDENGKISSTDGGVSIKPDHIDECRAAIDELTETEIVAPDITFAIGELSVIDFSVAELFVLDEIIKEQD